MTKIILCSLLLIVYFSSSAQWTSNGFNYTTDRLAIGTSAWTNKRLNVQGNDSDHIALMENSSASGFGLFLRAANDPFRIVPFSGSGNYLFVVGGNGNVGIGTSTPLYTLDVNGSIRTPNLNIGIGSPSTKRIYIRDNQPDHLGFFENTHPAGYGLIINAANDPLRVGSMGNTEGDQLIVKTSGNVGIGTTSPDAKLAVKGDIHTKEVRVDVTGSMVGDYVFEKDYNLISLPELETYLNQNKHLPDVTSATEFEAEGMKLKEMNLMLLKKVEELTLYMIEMNKKVERLQCENKQLNTMKK